MRWWPKARRRKQQASGSEGRRQKACSRQRAVGSRQQAVGRQANRQAASVRQAGRQASRQAALDWFAQLLLNSTSSYCAKTTVTQRASLSGAPMRTHRRQWLQGVYDSLQPGSQERSHGQRHLQLLPQQPYAGAQSGARSRNLRHARARAHERTDTHTVFQVPTRQRHTPTHTLLSGRGV